MTKSTASNYFAFLLRLWKEENHESWRASLEDPQTGERKAFADLPSLIRFLSEATEIDPTEDLNE